MPRPIDVQFDASEKLWRRVEFKDVDAQGGLKPSALRLQVSVVRERHGDIASVTHDKWNGVYEITAISVVAVNGNVIAVSCVDDPMNDQAGHALLAFHCTPGKPVRPEDVQTRRALLASSFVKRKAPTKV
jgi:hypothetical protein